MNVQKSIKDNLDKKRVVAMFSLGLMSCLLMSCDKFDFLTTTDAEYSVELEAVQPEEVNDEIAITETKTETKTENLKTNVESSGANVDGASLENTLSNSKSGNISSKKNSIVEANTALKKQAKKSINTVTDNSSNSQTMTSNMTQMNNSFNNQQEVHPPQAQNSRNADLEYNHLDNQSLAQQPNKQSNQRPLDYPSYDQSRQITNEQTNLTTNEQINDPYSQQANQYYEPNQTESQQPNRQQLDNRQAVISSQVTKVKYRSNSNQEMSAIFKTSTAGSLQANLNFTGGQNVKLTAYDEGGNNPVYRSQDGVIEMITYGGGGSVDVIISGQPMQFNAVSADAEVVASP